ncbi:MAG TPA: C39 family peptidase [Anaerolineales bacterium]|nr:C39 family peptidase [Anaerolineales bacterium]
MRKSLIGVLALPLLVLVAIGLYFVPPIHEHLAWRLEDLQTRIIYFFQPPSQAVFIPQVSQQVAIDAMVQATMQAYSTAQAQSITPTPAPSAAASSDPTAMPTATSAPVPATVSLSGVKYEDQTGRYNYCGPTNFSMALTFWGWNGNRDVIGKALMPGNLNKAGDPSASPDKNVMPFELQDYITENVPGMSSVLRYGGDIDLIKRLVAGGFPVVAEKGEQQYDLTGQLSWMGHYQYITGYDDNSQTLLIQDTYKTVLGGGPNYHVSYDEFMKEWRSFNYVFVVVYPSDRESDVMTLLGSYADEDWAAHHALALATADAQALTGIDQFFAWFDVGTSHVALKEYVDAAFAYDQAFQLYNSLPFDYSSSPFRVMWYETGPYFAYYYAGRYQDVINLANTTLNKTIAQPTLEESLYWRGMAEAASGDTQAALNDYYAALKIHPDYPPALQGLQSLGVQ